MSFPYKNPISAVQLSGPDSVLLTDTFGTNFSVSSVGGYMEVWTISDLNFQTFGATGTIQNSGNTIPVNFFKRPVSNISDRIELNSDAISSGRRRIGMLVYVHETDTTYQYQIVNYETLWDNAYAVTGVIQTSKNLMTKYYLYSVMLQQFQNQPVPDQLTQDIRLFSEKLGKEMPNSNYAMDFQSIVNNLDAQKRMAEAKTKLDVGALAPDIDLVKEDGTKVKLSSFKGKIVLMDFWASWCRPCRMENPNVVAAYNKYKAKGLVILSISQDQDLAKWKAAIGQDGLIWPTHFSDNLAGGVASSTYDVSYIPKTYLLDKSGKIAAKDLRGSALEAEIEKLTKTK